MTNITTRISCARNTLKSKDVTTTINGGLSVIGSFNRSSLYSLLVLVTRRPLAQQTG
jgi:hypothetical protein